MLAEIVLPAGTDRVTIRDIPALFADALHPALPDDTPRQITELRKIPLNAENIRQWCGEGCAPFPVSLKPEDMAYLAGGPWKALPPLVLPIDEEAFRPYQAASDKSPPNGWKLDWIPINRVMDARVLWYATEEAYLHEVRKAAMRGELMPRDPVHLQSRPDAIGELLKDCFVTVANLTEYAARLDIGVRVADVAKEPEAPPDSLGTASVSPVQRTAAQDAAILTAIRGFGHDPQSLPTNAPGRRGVKAQARAALVGVHPLFQPKSKVFDKAWDRLRQNGDIANAA